MQIYPRGHPLGLSAIQANEHHDARNGTAHHSHSAYSTTEAGTNALRHLIIKTI